VYHFYYPKGQKEYDGRVERSHRTDDEEFSLPCLAQIDNEPTLLRLAAAWLYYYNLERRHQGAGMEGKPPFVRLEELLDRKLSAGLALLPPVILDPISSDITLQGVTISWPYTGATPELNPEVTCRIAVRVACQVWLD